MTSYEFLLLHQLCCQVCINFSLKVRAIETVPIALVEARINYFMGAQSTFVLVLAEGFMGILSFNDLSQNSVGVDSHLRQQSQGEGPKMPDLQLVGELQAVEPR